jgi:hypothetical protein
MTIVCDDKVVFMALALLLCMLHGAVADCSMLNQCNGNGVCHNKNR